MKQLDINKATLDELKSVAFDTIRQIEFLRKQQETLNIAIQKKETEGERNAQKKSENKK